MKYSIDQIVNEDIIEFSDQVNLTDIHKDIMNTPDLKFHGFIKSIDENTFNVVVELQTNIVLPCSISLKEVEFAIDTDYDEVYSLLNDDNIYIEDNQIDIELILRDMIITLIPIKVEHPDAYNIIDNNKEMNFYKEDEEIKKDIKDNPFYKYFNNK